MVYSVPTEKVIACNIILLADTVCPVLALTAIRVSPREFNKADI